jgi:sorbitol-specific phosphotransferase system component IIA
MELLINIIGKNGGDIFKFAGDALLVIWPATENNDLEEYSVRAFHCAKQIQKKLNNGNSQPNVKESFVEEKVEKVIPTVVTPPTFEKTEENNFVKEEVKVEDKKEEVISDAVENKPKKPSSFSKLMGSLN